MNRIFAGFGALLAAGALSAGSAAANECAPTSYDALGPYYVSGTPILDNLDRFAPSGEAMRLSGEVRSATPPYAPVVGAKIEIWQTDADGRYFPQNNGEMSLYPDEQIDLRGTVLADDQGRWSVMTVNPAPYFPRPAHIHYVVTAPGHAPLVTQHYLSEAGGRLFAAPCRGGVVMRDTNGARFDAPAFFLSPA